MQNPYDILSWSKHYRQEALQEARRRHSEEQLRVGLRPRGLRRGGLAWRGVLVVLLRGARLTEQ